MLPGPPTIYQTMLDHPGRGDSTCPRLRLAVTGSGLRSGRAGRADADASSSFETVLTAYGLTEAVVATMCRAGDDPETVATHLRAGRPPDFELRLGDHDEVLLRGPNVMLGYLDDPEATARGHRLRRLAAHRRRRQPRRARDISPSPTG